MQTYLIPIQWSKHKFSLQCIFVLISFKDQHWVHTEQIHLLGKCEFVCKGFTERALLGRPT